MKFRWVYTGCEVRAGTARGCPRPSCCCFLKGLQLGFSYHLSPFTSTISIISSVSALPFYLETTTAPVLQNRVPSYSCSTHTARQSTHALTRPRGRLAVGVQPSRQPANSLPPESKFLAICVTTVDSWDTNLDFPKAHEICMPLYSFFPFSTFILISFQTSLSHNTSSTLLLHRVLNTYSHAVIIDTFGICQEVADTLEDSMDTAETTLASTA